MAKFDSGGADDTAFDNGERAKSANTRAAVVIACEQELRDYVAAHGRLPDRMPEFPKSAAAWWVDTFCAAFVPADDAARQIAGRSKIAWLTPYRDRVLGLLRKFLGLCRPEFQRYILAAREEGVHWRGDDEWMYPRIVDETLRYRDMDDTGRAAYRRSTKAQVARMRQVDKAQRQDREPGSDDE